MNVKLVVHGGTPALLDVMEGLVVRNARAIRRREVPAFESIGSRVRYVAQPTWFDAPSALRDGMASAGTLAAWSAADARVRYRDDTARVALVQGVPVAVAGLGASLRVLDDPSVRHGREPGFVQPIVSGSDDRVTEYLVLDIDDDASAVVDIGDAIARHNAGQVRRGEVPRLYESGVRYVTEGSPEQWLDAREIVRVGADDCEGLAAYRAGELLANGVEAGVAVRKIDAPNVMGGTGRGRLFHAITKVRGPGGKVLYDDPSANLGMAVPDWHVKQLREKRAAGRL